jgi:CheY-like chemotaxis protein
MDASSRVQPERCCTICAAGYAWRGLVRALGAGRQRPVVIHALHESEIASLRRGAKQTGIDQFISKPLTPDKLRAILAKLR